MEMALILGHERFASALCLVPMSVQIWPMNLSACRRISCCCWPVGGTARAAKGWPNELDGRTRDGGDLPSVGHCSSELANQNQRPATMSRRCPARPHQTHSLIIRPAMSIPPGHFR